MWYFCVDLRHIHGIGNAAAGMLDQFCHFFKQCVRSFRVPNFFHGSFLPEQRIDVHNDLTSRFFASLFRGSNLAFRSENGLTVFVRRQVSAAAENIRCVPEIILQFFQFFIRHNREKLPRAIRIFAMLR